MSSQNITVKILEKNYQIKCPEDSVNELKEAATFVDEEMRKIRDSGKVIGVDRIAVICALNHEKFHRVVNFPQSLVLLELRCLITFDIDYVLSAVFFFYEEIADVYILRTSKLEPWLF